MASRYAPLFEPFEVRGHRLRNRVVCPPMVTNRPLHTDAARQWYGDLADGGAGLVIVESTRVDRVGHQVGREHLSALAGRLHAGGAVAAIQLSLGPVDGAQEPDHFTDRHCGEAVRLFAEAARIAVEAGFDGVEPHGAHGFLLNAFFSPLRNRRSKTYGASLAGRMRLGLEIVRACREAIGDGKLLLYRHTPIEPNGYTLDESLDFARELVAAGVDILDISPSSDKLPGDRAEPFRALGLAPVIGVGRLGEPERALEALTAGRCDLVAVGRGLIADPAWPRKLEADREDEIVLCTLCNEGCFASLRSGDPVECVQRR